MQVAPTISLGDQFDRPFVGTLCFWDRLQTYEKINDKYEASRYAQCSSCIILVAANGSRSYSCGAVRLFHHGLGSISQLESGLFSHCNPHTFGHNSANRVHNITFLTIPAHRRRCSFDRIQNPCFCNVSPKSTSVFQGPCFCRQNSSRNHLPRVVLLCEHVLASPQHSVSPPSLGPGPTRCLF